MGSSQSTAKECKKNKTELKESIKILDDTLSVMYFYASASLFPVPPVKFESYKTFSDFSKSVFSVSETSYSQFSKIDSKVSTFKDFSQKLTEFHIEYEALQDESSRKKSLENVFNLAYAAMDILAETISVRIKECNGTTLFLYDNGE
jgi:hypothetical protein